MDLGRILALLIAVALTACNEVSAERTHRDFAEIGRADLGEIQARIEQGVALAVDASIPWVRFRANAPSAMIIFKSSAPVDRTVAVEVANAFEACDCSEPAQLIGPNILAFSLVVPAGSAKLLTIRPTGSSAVTPFRFAWVGDVQGGYSTFKRVRERINTDPSLEFTLFAGDITQLGEQSEIDDFIAVANGLDYPWYSVIGNHDAMFGQPLAFQRTVGRINVLFDYKGARFVILDTSAATVDPEVYDFLKAAMRPKGPTLRIAAMHIPPFDPEGFRDGAFNDRAEAARLLEILARGGTDLILAGHIHTLRATWQAGIETWISGRGGVSRGTAFDHSQTHYLAVTVDPEQNTIAVDPVFLSDE
jgi:predicted phosphodiesterase